MQAQASPYQENIQEIYSLSGLNTKAITQLLDGIKKRPEDAKALLQELNLPSTQWGSINLQAWTNFIRMLIRTTKGMKNQEVNSLLAAYFQRGVQHFFAHQITERNFETFEPLLKIGKGLKFEKPAINNQNVKNIVLYLQGEIDNQWATQLINVINNQVLVDKKNQSSNSLKLNPYFGAFVSQNFAKFVPQLQRLMVRSQNNIQVLVQFFEVLGSKLEDLGENGLNLLKKYKHLFQTRPDFSLRMVKALTQGLKQENAFSESFEFVKGLISTEHNSKKKIIFFRMLEGIIIAQGRYNHPQKYVNDIISCIILSWAKFIEEQQANFVFEALNNILPLISEPTLEIADLCKQSLKSNNKFILIFTGVTLSSAYRKSEHFDEFASVKECFTTVNKLLSDWMKKRQASWHFILPFMNFASTYELDLVEDLTDISSLFKKSCLALLPIQQSNALDLIVNKYIKYLIKNADGEKVEISDEVCLTIALFLENNKKQHIWKNAIDNLDQESKIQIIYKGLYPLIYLVHEPLINKNKNNQYISLSRAIFRSFNGKITSQDQTIFQKLIAVLTSSNSTLQKHLQLQNSQNIQKISQKYILLSLCCEQTRQSEKSLISQNMHNLHIKITNNLFKIRPIYGLPLINDVLAKLLTKKYYETDRTFTSQMQEKQNKAVNSHFESVVNPCKEILQEGELFTEVKIPQKKIYVNAILDAKMMSQAEVKEEQYREHFNKMLYYFENIIEILLNNIKNVIEEENNIWDKNFEGFIHITEYPEHRMALYRIVKASFEFFSIRNIEKEHQKSYLALKKLFLRYSNFFADFYSIRGAHMTPPVSLMEKCQKFFLEFLNQDYSILPKNNYSITFINDLSLYVLENMEFDLSVKELALNFFNSCIQKKQGIDQVEKLYGFLVKNLNIISNSENIGNVLLYCMGQVDSKRFGELFVEILNYVNKTKKLVLNTLLKSNDENKSYEPTFEDYIKLRILALDDSADDEISKAAEKLLSLKSKNTSDISSTIANFDMKNFVKNNTKDTIQKLCKFMKESITASNIDDVFNLVLRSAEQLYDENFDQEGLEFLPYFLSLNLEMIPEKFLDKIFEIFVLKYTANKDYATLSKMSVDTGIDIIKHHAHKSGEKMLLSMESFLTRAKGISNIVFLGVLAPFLKGNKKLSIIEKRISELFQGDNQVEQRAIAKNMPDLMSFFKDPDQIVSKIFSEISQLDEKAQSGQSYLASGLLKGLGPKQTLSYLEVLISDDYPSKTKQEKMGRCFLFRAFIENFGRVVELKSLKIISVLLQYMSDQNEEVRNISKSVAQTFVIRMSSYSIRELLPRLLEGLENEQNWRVKIAYIWILGIMANCSAKQLQTSLPIIVPTLSGCLSNAHPTIREKASEALNLIGETIKNPEISSAIDVLIEALQNPFDNSQKAIDILLKTRFSHYIDPPSLSIIVPIIDYCLRGRVTELKEGACQVIGSISELIQNPSDMLPYLNFVGSGIKTALCDPLPEIRSIAAMAIGKISSKIGAQAAREYFSFIYEIINSHTTNTTEKTGAAQAYAEVICSQDYDYFEESLNEVFAKLSQPSKTVPKQGYILIFLYVPGIKKEEFQGFIKEVNESTYCYVSDEDEALRNSSMQVSKVLITNYGISHTELLLEPLCDAIFEANWRKRNSALILLGQLLNILKGHMFHTKNNDKLPQYYQSLMAVYIMKDDDLQMPRVTANQVWNTYIENTPKTIKSGLQTLIKMWTKFTHAAGGVVFKNIVGFTSKYGENYFSEMLEYLEEFSKLPEHREGVFEVLGQLFKRMSQQFLSKPSYRTLIRKFFDNHIFEVDGIVRESLTRSLALYVEKMHEDEYFENLIFPKIDKMAELSEQVPEYTEILHLVRDLLHTSSAKVVDRLIAKVTENPLSEFKIEVITNNTDKIANNLYSGFKVPATEGMLEQITNLINQPSKEVRLSLLVYCLNQVSIRLNPKYKNMYIKMLENKLRVFKNKKEEVADIYYGVVEKLLEMLVFFLNSIELEQIDSLDELIGQIAPHIFDGTDTIKANAHKIFILLISDSKTSKTGLYYKQMIVSLENQHNENKNRNKTIWNQQSTVKEYVGILVKGLVYGNSQNIEDNIEMIKFMIKNTEPSILNPEIPRILGPIIRVSSYPLYQRQKERLLEFIKEMYCKGYDGLLEVYNYQVVSVCLRVLNESRLLNKKSSDMTEEIAKTLYFVITKQKNARNRDLLINFIQEKIKGETLAELMYKITEQIVRESTDSLSNTTYAKIKNNFEELISSAEPKISMKGIYYASKIISMLSVTVLKEQQQQKQILTYEDLILHLQRSYYQKEAVPKLEKVEILIRQSPRDKVYYILKSLHECCLANTRTEQVYTSEYIRSLVPEALSGFEDIVEILQYFD